MKNRERITPTLGTEPSHWFRAKGKRVAFPIVVVFGSQEQILGQIPEPTL